MITKTLKIGLSVIAIASISFAGAQEKQEIKKDKSEKMFNHLDADSDNVITLEEFKAKRMKDVSKKAQVEKRFAKLDTDENGTLDREEFKIVFENRRKSNQMNNKKKQEKKE